MTRRWTRQELHALRSLPLEPIARRLGYRQDPRDRARWRRAGSVISINATCFFDHRTGSGGAGAFDLLMHAQNCSFAEAAATLMQEQPIQMPNPSEQHWPAVRQHLSTRRGIPTQILDACKRRGILYADQRQNAVFRCTDTARRTTGAEILGTRTSPDQKAFKAMAKGSRKAQGAFWIPTANQPPDTLFLTESALDALSAFALKQTPKGATVFASTAGATPNLPKWIETWKPARILCAFDADTAGDQNAKALAKRDPSIRRCRPQAAKDWNEIIRKQT